MTVELRVLGPIEAVESHGAVIDLGTRMHRSVLALLVMEAGRVVTFDRLIDDLWGDAPPPTARKALQTYVSGLRRALEPDRPAGAPAQRLMTHPHGYMLRVPTEAIDAVRFEALVAEGRDLLDAGEPTEAGVAIESALGLWRGGAYEDLAFASFVQPEIRRLDELRASAAEGRIEALLATGREIEAVVDAERLLGESPLRERRWALLALALYRAGRQGEALRALDRARGTLGEELGVEPGPELRRMEQDILAQAPVLELRTPEEHQSRALRHLTADSLTVMLEANHRLVPPAGGGGAVLPAADRPHGYSLADMAALVIPFQLRRYDPAWRPDTPLVVLYVESFEIRRVGTGVLATASSTFAASPTTYFYVPLMSESDAPVTAPGFPVSPEEAVPFFFGPARLGARDFELIVDGASTPIGPDYLVGPHARTDIEDEHYVMLAAFVGPLSSGTHVIAVRGGYFGSLAANTYGAAFTYEDIVYTVEDSDGD